MTEKRIIVLDPTSKVAEKELEIPSPLKNLEGKIMGVVWNGKLGADILLDRFAERLKERFRLDQIIKLQHRADSFSDIPENTLNEYVEKCAFVLVGVGD